MAAQNFEEVLKLTLPLEDRMSKGADRLGPGRTFLLLQIAKAYAALKKSAEAAEYYKRAASIQEKTFGQTNLQFADTLVRLGVQYHLLGRYKEAEHVNKRVLAIVERAPGKNNKAVASSLFNLGVSYEGQRKYTEAEAVLGRASEILQKEGCTTGSCKVEDGQSLLVHVIVKLSNAYRAQGKDRQADELLEKHSIVIKAK